MAAVFAKKGFNVIGLDVNPEFVSKINAGTAPLQETQLQEYVNSGKANLRATTDYDDAIKNSDITFIILPTPSDDSGFFSNDYVLSSVTKIGAALRSKTGYHLVVITSTTMPGATNGIIRETLEKSSGRKLGPNLGLCYSPEFIALGSVIKNMLNPDFILIGESDRQAGDVLQSIYSQTCENTPLIKRMTFTSAELTKLCVNTFVTTKISFANMVAEYCEHLEGAEAEIVMDAVGSDSRIGKKYLQGAIGYGGPCFPRDNRAFYALGQEFGLQADLAKASDTINNHQVVRLKKTINQIAQNKHTVAILGLAYKPETDVAEESQGVLLANILCNDGYSVTVFDPMAVLNSKKLLDNQINIAQDLEDALKNNEVIVITTPWAQFSALPDLIDATRARIIIDPWRVINPEQLPETVLLITMGRTLQSKP
ncbi:MAG: nucleotide sugar dehydrogenase [Pseudomonadales bacterium]|nr:nucleotide sugar dehydrogenase [Pseudomonadales bacterium]